MKDDIHFSGVPRKRPIRVGKTSTVNIETGEVISETANTCSVMPPPPGVCPECGTDHAYDQPHNQQSLTYQYQFYGKNGRWPTWSDAMSHCPGPVRATWTNLLIKTMREKGITVPADLCGLQAEGRQS